MKIGILGGGQLGRMLALAGIPLGHQFLFWEPGDNPPASDVGEVIKGSFDDTSIIPSFTKDLDCVTYEFENIPAELIGILSKECAVFPSKRALEVSQDRLNEKSAFAELGITFAPFSPIESVTDLENSQISLPAILKTRRLGYDGKGQSRIASRDQFSTAWETIGKAPAVLEQQLQFDAELSLLCARGRDGAHVFYPLVENQHTNGILSSSRVPSRFVTQPLQAEAEKIGAALLKHLEYVGLLTIEFFLVGGKLIANEMAPRVHNSGHWTIEGAETSQFENHIRAITGAPLGSTALRGHSVMLNLVGDVPDPAVVLNEPYSHLHLYRKSGREKRKIGHITLTHTLGQPLVEIETRFKSTLKPYLKF
jgi:5-(carboxyamino)imidazole ribonucleotide synthase